jgi:hypothetical protein
MVGAAPMRRLAEGRPAGLLPDLLASIFTLGAHAQRCTARRAIAAALGGDDAAPTMAPLWQAEAQLVALATAREHLQRFALDLPQWLPRAGLAVDPGWLRDAPVRSLPASGAAPAELQAMAAALPGWLERHLLGLAPADWLRRWHDDPAAWLADWAAGSTHPLGRWLAAVRTAAQAILLPCRPLALFAVIGEGEREGASTSVGIDGGTGVGMGVGMGGGTGGGMGVGMDGSMGVAVDVGIDAGMGAGKSLLSPRPHAPDEAGLRALADALRQVPDFAEQPLWQGAPAETGPWTRAARPHEAPRAADAWVRLGARLADLVAIGCDGAGALAGGSRALGPGEGIAWTEMSRGLLMHWVRLDAGPHPPDTARVRSYRVLAPTEWNFHPQSALGLALAEGRLEGEAARLAALALDPCIRFELAEPGHA